VIGRIKSADFANEDHFANFYYVKLESGSLGTASSITGDKEAIC